MQWRSWTWILILNLFENPHLLLNNVGTSAALSPPVRTNGPFLYVPALIANPQLDPQPGLFRDWCLVVLWMQKSNVCLRTIIKERQGNNRSREAQRGFWGGCYSRRHCLTDKAQIRAGTVKLRSHRWWARVLLRGPGAGNTPLQMANSTRRLWGAFMLLYSSKKVRSWKVCL